MSIAKRMRINHGQSQTINNYPLLPQALPIVVKAWVYYQENLFNLMPEKKPFSIRLAKWVARLYCITEDIKKLIDLAYEISISERACELTNISLQDVSPVLTNIRAFKIMTTENILYDEDRLRKVSRGYNLPDGFISKTSETGLDNYQKDEFDGSI